MNKHDLRLHIYRLGMGTKLPHDLDAGLCSEVEFCADNNDQVRMVEHIMSGWDNASDNERYPVPHPYLNPSHAYVLIKNKWCIDMQKFNSDKTYVKNRLYLCRFVAYKLGVLEDWK